MVSVRWRPTTDADVVLGADCYLRDCFVRQRTPRVSELSTLLGISRTRLTRAVQRHTGLTCIHYLHLQQVNKAKERIDAGAPLIAAGYEAGFNRRRTFFRVFKQVTGITPACYRRTE